MNQTVKQVHEAMRVLAERVDAVESENKDVHRRNGVLKSQLDDALDRVAELQGQNAELQTVNEELRRMTGGAR